ncbi:hypothetical protein QAD02_006482 [Eretmocerus hayati]|uniref:Uncharacterized protein n=1 Tax=Eretmocerus hayati TaxID=131215 RepID=A0ACC2N103_9HYME|nr:hypothetical protein QAD02_006482 [Eretmocerus hayati]
MPTIEGGVGTERQEFLRLNILTPEPRLCALLEEVFHIVALGIASLAVSALSMAYYYVLRGNAPLIKKCLAAALIPWMYILLMILNLLGQDVINSSDAVFDSIYMCDWYRARPKDRKILLLLMQRSLRVSYLTAATCYDLTRFAYRKQQVGFDEFQVSLKVHGRHVCGGTLISHTHIITADQCIDGFLKQFQVKSIPTMNVEFFSDSIWSRERSKVGTFSKVVSDFDKGGKVSWDTIGIIKLVNKIEAPRNTEFPRLFSKNLDIPQNEMIIGSEKNRRTLWHETRSLNLFWIRSLHHEKCIKHFPLLGSVSTCAVLESDTKDCKDIIGHPVIYDGEIFGIVTHTSDNCNQGSLIVYARINGFISSIQKEINHPHKCLKPACYNVQDITDSHYAEEDEENELGLQKAVRLPSLSNNVGNSRNAAVNFWGSN